MNRKIITKLISYILLICISFSLIISPVAAEVSENKHDSKKLSSKLQNKSDNSKTTNAKKAKEDLKNSKIKNEEAITDRYIVKYKPEKREKAKEKIEKTIKKKLKTANLVSKKKDKNIKKNKNHDVILTDKKMKLKDLASLLSLEASEDIEYIQPDYQLKLETNDTYFDEQWGLHNVLGYEAPEETVTDSVYNDILAWHETEGEGILVAVIDTGIDIDHEDLKNSIWINEKEIPDNGIDDDGNGYIDDIKGWNFHDDTNTVKSKDINEIHGTHISGIISAEKDNGKGIAGVAPRAKILPLKVFSGDTAYTSDIIEAIEYAKEMGADIVNCSWGGADENPALKEAIEESGLLFIVSAGNGSKDIDTDPVYPASYDSKNILTVASINQENELSYFSNYGQASVDVVAPGEDIISTLPDNKYGKLSGTSMSTAFVTGEGALVLSQNIDIDNNRGIELIIDSSETTYQLANDINVGDYYGGELQTVTEEVYGNKTVFQDVYGIPKQLPEALKIIYKISSISEATDDEKLIISQYFGADPQDILICEENGYSLNESIEMASMARKYSYTIDEILKIKNNYGDLDKAKEELRRLNFIIQIRGISGEEIVEVKELFMGGHSVDDILDTYLASNKGMNTLFTLSNNGNYSTDISYDKYFSPPFDYRSKSSEDISPNVGNLSYKSNLLSLPGRSGLDLNIDLQYDSSKANLFDAYYDYDIEIHNYIVMYSGDAYSVPYLDEIVSSNDWHNELDWSAENPAPSYDLKESYKTFKTYNDAKDFVSNWLKEKTAKYDLMYSSSDDGYLYNRVLLEKFGFDGPTMPLCKKMNLEAIIYSFQSLGMESQRGRVSEINQRTSDTYIENNNGLGAGWSYGFSSIETQDETKYLHLSSGSAYKINITSETGDSNLEKYTLRDMRLEESSGLEFQYNSLEAKYALIYKNQNKEFFDIDGRLIGIRDRYGNTIKFEYDYDTRYPKAIVDTLNRRIVIEKYSDRVEIKAPDMLPIVIKLLDLSSKLDNHSYNDYAISEIHDMEGRVTKFDYTFGKGDFNFFSKDEDDLNIGSDNVKPGENIFANLNIVNYPSGAITKYTYEKAIGNLGKDGLYEYYRIDTRQDIEDTKVYNKQTYIYGGDIKEYPVDNSSSSIKDYGERIIHPETIRGTRNDYIRDYYELNIGKYRDDEDSGISIKFRSSDIGDLPYNSEITNAVLDLDVIARKYPIAHENLTIGAYRIIRESGIENTVQPEDFLTNSFAETTIPYLSDTEGWNRNYYWNLTGIVRGWHEGIYPNYGAYLFDTQGIYINFPTRSTAGHYHFEEKGLTLKYKAKGKRTTNHTGYPLEGKPDSLTDGFKYKTIIETEIDEEAKEYLQTIYTFNNKHLQESVEVRKIVKTTNYNAESKVFTYPTEEDELLRKTVYKYDTNRVPESETKTIYNTNGDSTEVESSWSYNNYGDLLKYVGEEGHITKYQYDDNFHMMKQSEQQIDDSRWKRTEYDIDQTTGNINWIKQHHSEDGTDKSIIIKYPSYDSYGNVLEKQIQESDGTVIMKENYSYGPDEEGTSYNNAYLTKRTVEVTDYEGNKDKVEEKYTYYPSTGLLRSYRDGRQNLTTYEYDNLGRKTKEINADTTYKVIDYDDTNNIVTLTTENGHKVRQVYDGLGRLKNILELKQGTSDEWITLQENSYNALSQLVWTKDVKGIVTNEKTSYEYDILGRIIRVTNPDLTYTQTKYYDVLNKKVEIDEEQKEYISIYDNVGNLKEERVKPDSTKPLEYITIYDYDYLGNLIHIRDPRGNVTTYGYDDLGRLEEVKNPKQEKISYKYNSLGNLTKLIMQEYDNTDKLTKEIITEKEYDELGRLIKSFTPYDKAKGRNEIKVTKIAYDRSGNPDHSIDMEDQRLEYSYDNLNRILVQSAKKKNGEVDSLVTYDYTNLYTQNKITITDDTGMTTYEYYEDGKLKKESLPNSVDKNTIYEYYDDGNLQYITDPFGLRTEYTYDSRNRIDLIKVDGKTFNYDYHDDGMIKTLTYPNTSIKTEFTYYDTNQLSTLKNTIVSEINNHSYGYDPNGNISTITENAVSTSYTYDKLNRLDIITRPGNKTINFSYDARGNRKEIQANDHEQLDYLHRLNLGEYKYNPLNQLESYTAKGDTYQYKYSHRGLRTEKITPEKTIKYHYDQAGRAIAESDETGNVTAQNIWGHKPLARKVNGKYYYYLYNGHGDVVKVVDESGNIVNRYAYDEWGNNLEQEEQIENPIRYAGEYFDEESGLYYLRARYYDPTTGRFISKDSYEGRITNPLSLNLYTYCYNNPLRYVDPDGHTPRTMKVGNKYHFEPTNRFKELVEDATGFAPFGGLVVWFVEKAGGKIMKYEKFEHDDIGAATSLYLDALSRFSDCADDFIGKVAGGAGAGLTLKSLAEEYYDTDYQLEEIINFLVGDSLTSNSREKVIAKFLYAKKAVKEMTENGDLTYTYENNGVIGIFTRNKKSLGYDPELINQLKEELEFLFEN